MTVEWEEPPDKVGVHERFFDELRTNRGEWAVFKRDTHHPGGLVQKLRDGKYRGIEPGELEVRQTHTGSGRYTIYVRAKDNGRGSR